MTVSLDMMPDADEMRRAEEARQAKLKNIIEPLESEARRRVERKRPIEDRWIEDLAQYHGRYDRITEKSLKEADRSRVFINLTRPKSDAMAARLEDMLFPTDDKNWGISPTPVPELAEEAEAAAMRAAEAVAEATKAANQEGSDEDPRAIQLAQTAQAAEQQAATLKARVDEAKKRAEAMEAEIEDLLEECQYQAISRDQISDACKLGIGVTKGPVVKDNARQRWTPSPSGEFVMQPRAETRGAIRYVDPWSVYFDPDARSVEEGEGVFERHLSNKKALRRLARQPGFNQEAIRRLLAQSPADSTSGGGTPDYLNHLRDITGDQQQVEGPLFWVWEYSGPIAGDALRALYEALGDEEGSDLLDDEVDEVDEMQAVIWFCNGEVLKVDPYPLDSGECLYSVFTLVRDEASIYGYGIPRMMRHQQSAYNTAWRMALDNAGLAAGPMIAIMRKYLEPADGKWELRPRKVWLIKEDMPDGVLPIRSIDVNAHLEELLAIIQAFDQQIDDTTGMPQVAQGEQGSGVTKTAQGMAILMSSSNVIFRRVVKNYDDDQITPTIRRLYDWLMQTSDKAQIKGDYEVKARGSGVLLVRELQSQNLMAATAQYGAHPVYGPMIDHPKLLRKTFQAQMIPADEIVKSDDQIMQEQAAMREQQDPAAEVKMREMELKEKELSDKIAMHEAEWDKRLMISENSLEEARIRAQIASDDKAADRATSERKMAAEVGARERYGDGAGGAI
ncbi:MAG: hypothetical protein AAGD08_15935 [Pseudomonadota bacterium]